MRRISSLRIGAIARLVSFASLKEGWLTGISLIFVLQLFLAAFFLGLWIQQSEAAEKIIVDLNQVTPARSPFKIANAFLEGWKDDLPKTTFLDPLSPVGLRDGAPVQDKVQAIPWLSGYVQALGDTGTYVYLGGTDHSVQIADLTNANLVTSIPYLRQHYPRIKFQYDMFNEPDLYNTYPGDKNQFYADWDSTFKRIKRADPAATITGPSFSGLLLYAPWPGQPSGHPYMVSFLDYCARHKCVPDDLGWIPLGSACGLQFRANLSFS